VLVGRQPGRLYDDEIDGKTEQAIINVNYEDEVDFILG